MNFIRCEASASHLPSQVCAPHEEAPESEDTGATLDEAARDEQEYLRQRLREELKRRAEQLALSVKGVRTVDNKIIVEGGIDSATQPPD